jgi:hypothetical protein
MQFFKTNYSPLKVILCKLDVRRWILEFCHFLFNQKEKLLFCTIFCIRWRDRGRHGRDRMVVEFTNVVSSKLIHGEVYSIQHYLINVCQWLTTGQWFYQGTPVSPTNKTDLHDNIEKPLMFYYIYRYVR